MPQTVAVNVTLFADQTGLTLEAQPYAGGATSGAVVTGTTLEIGGGSYIWTGSVPDNATKAAFFDHATHAALNVVEDFPVATLAGAVLLQATQTGVTIPTVTTITNGVSVASGGITAGSIASSTFTAAKFAADSITASALAADAVTEIVASMERNGGSLYNAGAAATAAANNAATIIDLIGDPAGVSIAADIAAIDTSGGGASVDDIVDGMTTAGFAKIPDVQNTYDLPVQ